MTISIEQNNTPHFKINEQMGYEIIDEHVFLKRSLAAAVDILFIAYFMNGMMIRTNPETLFHQILGLSLGYLFAGLFNAYLVKKHGGSFGKSLFKLKIIRVEDGDYLSAKDALIRELFLRPLNLLLLGIPNVYALFTNQQQSFIDKLLKQRVISTRVYQKKIDPKQQNDLSKELIQNSKYIKTQFLFTKIVYSMAVFIMLFLIMLHDWLNQPIGKPEPDLYAMEARFAMVATLAFAFILKMINNKEKSILKIHQDYQSVMSASKDEDCLESQMRITTRFLTMRGIAMISVYMIFGGLVSVLPILHIYKINFSTMEYLLWIFLAVATAITLFPRWSELEKQLTLGTKNL